MSYGENNLFQYYYRFDKVVILDPVMIGFTLFMGASSAIIFEIKLTAARAAGTITPLGNMAIMSGTAPTSSIFTGFLFGVPIA